MALCLFLSVLCVVQTISNEEYLLAAKEIPDEDWEIELWLEAPSPFFYDDPPAAEPPTSPGPRQCPTRLRLTCSDLGANGAGERSSAGGGTRRLIRLRRQLPEQSLHSASLTPPLAKWTSQGVGGTGVGRTRHG